MSRSCQPGHPGGLGHARPVGAGSPPRSPTGPGASGPPSRCKPACPGHRYWPVLATLSIDQPPRCPTPGCGCKRCARPSCRRCAPSRRGWSSCAGSRFGLPDPAGRGARRINEAILWLEQHKLITVENRAGQPNVITLLSENGTGTPYELPGTAYNRLRNKKPASLADEHRYIQLPNELWTNGWLSLLSGAAVAMLLVLYTELGNRPATTTDLWFSPHQADLRFGLREDTRSKGLRGSAPPGSSPPIGGRSPPTRSTSSGCVTSTTWNPSACCSLHHYQRKSSSRHPRSPSAHA